MAEAFPYDSDCSPYLSSHWGLYTQTGALTQEPVNVGDSDVFPVVRGSSNQNVQHHEGHVEQVELAGKRSDEWGTVESSFYIPGIGCYMIIDAELGAGSG